MAQRVTCSCDCSVVLGVLDLLTGIFVFLSGLLTLLGAFDFDNLRIFLLGAFFMIIGTSIISLALAWIPFLDIWFPFYTRSFMGKGLFFLFLGCLLFVPPGKRGRNTVFFVFSLLVLITAVVYMILHCVAGIPAPYPLLQACGIQCHCDCCGGSATATSHSTVNPGAMSTYKSSTVTRTVHRV